MSVEGYSNKLGKATAVPESEQAINPEAYRTPYLVLWSVNVHDPSDRAVYRDILAESEDGCRREFATARFRARYPHIPALPAHEYTREQLLSYCVPPPEGRRWEVTVERGYIDPV